MRPLFRLATPRCVALGSLLVLWAASPGEAIAQIWVVTGPDGTERFTTQPEPGARLYMRTPHAPKRSSGRIPQVPYGQSIAEAAAETGLEPALITAVIAAESNFDRLALSSKGAQGLMQLMPETAAELGVRDVWDAHANIRGGSTYLARLVDKFGELPLALAAYNAGERSVQRYGGVPPFRETQDYVRRVLSYYSRYTGG